MEATLKMTEDDMDDLLEAIRHYEDELMFGGDDSQFVEAVLDNLASLRERIYAARRENLS